MVVVVLKEDMATRAISHPPHSVNTSPKIPLSSKTPPYFCKQCDVMFESATSLEVHLSYHKDSLLSRWANPETTNSQRSGMDNNGEKNSTSTNNSQPTQSSPRDGAPPHNNSPYPSYFHPDQVLGLYLPPQYNNNTGDRSNDTQVTTASGLNHRPIPSYPSSENQTNYGNGIPTTMSGNAQFSSSPHQQLFSPNMTNGGTPRQGENPPSIKQERNETPAEILDLDSHKVHIYQQQQQQQQQQQLQGGDPLTRNSFYRPYLPHLLPPLPPNPNNGWPQPLPPPAHPQDQFPSSFSDHHSIPHPYGIPPQPPSGNIVYDLIREDAGRGGYGSSGDGLPPMGYPQLGPLSTPSFRGAFPPSVNGPQPPSTESANTLPPLITGNSRNTPPPKKSPLNNPPSANNKGKGASAGNGAAPKTKGWKGGECKRPKTYNCVACNKWFTSSGHLKRHYGTTLHKNSVKQKGESPEEHQQQQAGNGRKAGGKKSPGDKMSKGGDSNSMDITTTHSDLLITGGGNNSPSPPRNSIKHEDSTSSGKSSPVYVNSTNAQNGRPGEFNSLSPNPPYMTNPYLPYNCPPGPPLHPQYVLQNHFPSPSLGPVPFSNGFGPDPGAPLGVYSVANSMVPTTMYNGGYSVITSSCETPPLPPFSSVGFSHYDPSTFTHMTPFPPQASPSSRMTPNGGSLFHGGPPMSPPRSTNNNNLESSFGPDARNSTNPLNRDSPEAVRSASTASGSMEGSLDRISPEGSPGDHSLSDFSSGAESIKEVGDSDPEPSSGGEQVFKCPECSKTFGRSCYLTQHTNSSHSGGKPFKCSTCGKRFPEEPALSDHFAKHGENKPYKCDQCPKQFNHKTDLRRHLCLHSGEKPFTCSVCGKGFIRKDHMNKHGDIHRKQNLAKLKLKKEREVEGV